MLAPAAAPELVMALYSARTSGAIATAYAPPSSTCRRAFRIRRSVLEAMAETATSVAPIAIRTAAAA